jgi:hypothetical protein
MVWEMTFAVFCFFVGMIAGIKIIGNWIDFKIIKMDEDGVLPDKTKKWMYENGLLPQKIKDQLLEKRFNF